MTEILLLTALTIMMVAFLVFKIAKPFSPWVITTAIWTFILVLFQFEGHLLYPLSTQFYICLTLWVPIFVASSLITYFLLPRVDNEETSATSEMQINNIVFNIFFGLSMIITPMYFYKALQVVLLFDTSDLFQNLRLLAVYGDESYGFIRYSYVINHVLLAVGLWRYPKMPLWQLIAIYGANILSFLAIMEKGTLFFIIISSIFVFYEKRLIKPRTIGVIAIASLLLFFLTNRMRSTDDELLTEDSTLLSFIALYIMSPAVAFGKTAIDITTQFGSHTFQVFYLFMERFGFDVEVNQKLQEFVMVPMPTNVYTIFQPFFQDFGYAGVAIFAIAYGTSSGWVYRAYQNGNALGRCVYVYLVYVLLLQFFQENIFMSIVLFGQYVFFLFLITERRFSIRLYTNEQYK